MFTGEPEGNLRLTPCPVQSVGPAIWRFDPTTEEMVLIARDVYGAASIAFGQGDFDHESIYVSTTYNGGRGGKIWRVPVGVKGAELNR